MRMAPVRGPDAGTLLVRALGVQAADAGVAVAVRSIASRPWASATFTGMRHRIALDIKPGDGCDRWITALPDAEWVVHRHLIADIVIDRVTVEGDDTAVLISVLTIEDN